MSDVMDRTGQAHRRRDTVSEHLDVIRAIEQAVADNLNLLAPLGKAWQPTDYLPDLESANWRHEVEGFRKAAEAVSDQLLVVLVGDMVTEEALPSYSVSLNGLVRDEEGTGPAPWARWLRGWTAEENRHGDLLSAYLRLTGRVDMRAIERTVHSLIVNGFNPKSRTDPYNLLVYTSFQERATRISHRNVGRMAARDGDPNLARICGVIAGDEARHEAFYTRMMSESLAIRTFQLGDSRHMGSCPRIWAVAQSKVHDGRTPNERDIVVAAPRRLSSPPRREMGARLRQDMNVISAGGRDRRYSRALHRDQRSFADV